MLFLLPPLLAILYFIPPFPLRILSQCLPFTRASLLHAPFLSRSPAFSVLPLSSLSRFGLNNFRFPAS